jgi:hypothetical protein
MASKLVSSDPLFNAERAAAGDPFPFDTAATGLVEVTVGPIEFTPVPRLRRRRNGWTPEAQHAFIAALAQCGCVARAARAVGMTPRSAYRLLDAEGADGFAAAWDQAIARGIERLRLDALDRALNGAWVPVQRRGLIVRMERRINDRLAIALLSGRDCSVADRRERASSRRKYRAKLLAEKHRQADAQRAREEVRAAHQAVLDRIEAERENPVPRSIAAPPRIRRL